MPKRTNLKAVPTVKPGQLTYEQIRTLARGISDSIAGDEFMTTAVMVFTREIIEHCGDSSHVETVAMLLEDNLYTATPDFDRALERFIETKCAELLKQLAEKGL